MEIAYRDGVVTYFLVSRLIQSVLVQSLTARAPVHVEGICCTMTTGTAKLAGRCCSPANMIDDITRRYGLFLHSRGNAHDQVMTSVMTCWMWVISATVPAVERCIVAILVRIRVSRGLPQ